MALLHFEFEIDSDVHPELHAALLWIASPAARGERLRQLAASGLVWEAVRIHGRAVLDPASLPAGLPSVPSASAQPPPLARLPLPPRPPRLVPTDASPATSSFATASAPVPAARRVQAPALDRQGPPRHDAADEARSAHPPGHGAGLPPDFIDLAIDAHSLHGVLAGNGPRPDAAANAGFEPLPAALLDDPPLAAASPTADLQSGDAAAGATSAVPAVAASEGSAPAPASALTDFATGGAAGSMPAHTDTAEPSMVPDAGAPAADRAALGAAHGRDLPVLIDVVEWDPVAVGQRDGATPERPAFMPVTTVPHRPASQSRLKRMKDKGLFRNG